MLNKEKSRFSWKYIVLSFIVLVIYTITFAAEYTVPRFAYSVYAGDLDLDGDKDIVVGHKTAWGHDNPTISILLNEGAGTFTIFDTSFVFCGYQENIFAQNIDDDNYPEIVTFMADFSSGIADRYIRIFYNEYGFFNVFTDFTLNTSEVVADINYGDIDNDNDIDIVVASNNGQFWGVLYNNGTGQFSLPEYHYVTGYYPVDIACGNLNEDNRNDIAICAQKTEVYFSYETGFQCLTLEENNFKNEINIADMDYDGDNDIVVLVDLLMMGYTGITIYENIGNDNFYQHDEVLFQPALGHFEISDLNNDSFPDVVCTGYYDGIYILYNEGDYILSEPQFIPLSSGEEFLQRSFCADLDNNGFNDIITIKVVSALMPSTLIVLFNDGNGNFVEEPQVSIDNYELVINNYKLSNYPNPFNPKTNISFQLSEKCKISLSIYNTKGQLVKKLIDNETFQKGRHSVVWNGYNDSGKLVGSGVYFYKMNLNGKSESVKKCLLLK
ncbi:MAG: VCBS repeat-containing protein [Armatimonadetes bacterium]|nr:VCBS repeat-containing protein [Armatimonadota bacterium]